MILVRELALAQLVHDLRGSGLARLICWGGRGGARALRFYGVEGVWFATFGRRLVPPIVFAPLSLHQLGDALDLAFPEESLAVVDERVRGRSSCEGLAGRSQRGGHVWQEAALGRRELPEVAAEEHVHSGEGSDVVGGVVLPLRRGRDGAPGAEFHLRRDPGAHHADLVQDEPPPERDAARRVRPACRVQAALVPVEVEGLVQRLAADVRRVRGLEGGHLEVDALHVAEQVLEEFPPHEVEHVRLARAGTPVQQPEQRLLAVFGSSGALA